MTAVVPADWPIAPPFDFNAAEISRHSPEVTGRVLLKTMCERLGWPSLAGKSLLDFGCGVRFTRTIINLEMEIGRYIGIDTKADSIRWLQQNVRDRRFRFEHIDMFNPMYNPGGAPAQPDALVRLDLPPADAACLFSVITHQRPADAELILSMLRTCAPRIYFTALIDEAVNGFEDRDPANPCLLATYSTTGIARLLANSGWQLEASWPVSPFQVSAFMCSRC